MNNEKLRGDILVVEDTAASLHLLAHILTREGHKVRPVTDGVQALTAARSKPPDLVLLDIMMPGMNGFQVCEELKANERTCNVPIIFISSLSAADDKAKALALGGVDYVTKPFQTQEVLARVDTHLRLSRLQKEVEAANRELAARNAELVARNQELQEALATIKTLRGLIPMCAWCNKKIEDEDGHWIRVEDYIEARSDATFTHGMCPDCLAKMEAQADELFRTRRPKT